MRGARVIRLRLHACFVIFCLSEQNSSDIVIYSAYGDWLARGVSLLAKRTLGAKVDLIYIDVGVGRLIVTGIAVSSIVVVYAPNGKMEYVSFFCQGRSWWVHRAKS